MKILKRNQLIVLVISLMLITAGYLNFVKSRESIQTSMIANRDNSTIGDAQLVSTIPKENEGSEIENLIKAKTTSNQDKNINNEISEIVTSNNPNEDNNTKKDDTEFYFTTSKLERNTMYSELLETYQKMYNNTNATAEAKSDALSKINNINNTKNAIMVAENLIIAKGFEDVVIFSNEGSISVVVKAQELKQEQVAQIQNIVTRELNVDAGMIHISNK